MNKIAEKLKDITDVIVGITKFAERQINHLGNGFSQFIGEPKVLISLIKDAIGSGYYKIINENVLSVTIPTNYLNSGFNNFVTGFKKIDDNENPEIIWESRREGELPSPTKVVKGKLKYATETEIILYTGDALRSEKEEFSPQESDFAVVSINCGNKDFPSNSPMVPATILRNFLSQFSDFPYGKGGSFHSFKDLNPEEAWKKLLTDLEDSVLFWHDKAKMV